MRNLLAWAWPRLRRDHPELPEGSPTDALSERSGVEMFDRVTIRTAPATVDAGIAGLTGTVYGHTTPSIGYAEGLVGDPVDDLAVNVAVDGTDRTVWLTPDLVEFVARPPDLMIKLGRQWLRRQADGSWVEIADGDVRP